MAFSPGQYIIYCIFPCLRYSLLTSITALIYSKIMKTALLLILASFILLPSSAAIAKEDCLSCHGQQGMPGYVNLKKFQQTKHGKFACTDCHVKISGYPHGKVSSVNCNSCHGTGTRGAQTKQAQAFKQSVHGKALESGNPKAPKCQTCHGSHYIFNSSDKRSTAQREKIPALCSRCHPAEFKAYSSSIHGAEFIQNKNPGSATCFDCHQEHFNPSTRDEQWKLNLIRTCGNCHGNEIETYRKTYHGKVTQLGYTTMAKCSDCHGYHTIQQVKAAGSQLSEQNILATCQKCHPAATTGFTKFYAHPQEHNRNKYPLIYYPLVFMTLLLIGVFAFFFTHTLLWIYRALRERLQKKKGE